MPTLITIPFSHFCEKARWALDRARVEYLEEGHTPLMHKRAVYGACGKAGTVPVLLLDGEGVLDDSPLIVRWADGRATSDRKLLPSGGREREEALALEHHFDVDFAPHTRRLAYFHLLADRARTTALMGIATPRAEHTFVRLGYPLLRAAMRRFMRVDAEQSMRSRDKVRSIFDDVAARLADGRPFLLGDRFGIADIAFASLASPLLLPDQHPVRARARTALSVPPALEAEVAGFRETPAGKYALRMYREKRAD
jgi:glutathione S-transferase